MDAVLRPNDHNTIYTSQHDYAAASPTKTAQPRTRGSPGLRGSPGFNLVSDAAAEQQHMGGGSTSASPLRGINNPGAGRRAFLTPERIASRHSTLIDAFHTADRKQRERRRSPLLMICEARASTDGVDESQACGRTVKGEVVGRLATERPGKLEYVKRRCVVVKTSASGAQTAIGREGSLGEVVGSTYV